MLAVVLSAVLALSSHGSAHAAAFPVRGLVVPGKSIGGVKLGETTTAVQAQWGKRYYVCSYCDKLTWLYEYQTGEPLGAAVTFVNNKVVAVFTLGSPAGWGEKGLMMGDPISNVYAVFSATANKQCIGYTALTVREGAATTSFYSASGVVYGYALTAPSEPTCQ
jgi:hypothetical protein